jgi:sec-independent protein translocase protein TatA
VNFGPTELLIVLIIVVLLFGSAKLPKLARSLGQAKNEFEAGSRETERGGSTHEADRKPEA